MFALIFINSAHSQFGRNENSLKDLAESKGKYLGNIMSSGLLFNQGRNDNGNANKVLKEHFNTVVLENDFKMAFILPRGNSAPNNIHNLSISQLKTLLNKGRVDQFLAYENGKMRKRGHAFIWYSQAPSWLNNAAPGWSAQQVFDFSRKYIKALGELVGDSIQEWDVINEAISDYNGKNGKRIWRENTWYRNVNN